MFLAFLVIGFFLAWLLGHVIAGILKIKYVTDAMKEDKKQKQEQEQKQQMPPPQAEQERICIKIKEMLSRIEKDES